MSNLSMREQHKSFVIKVSMQNFFYCQFYKESYTAKLLSTYLLASLMSFKIIIWKFAFNWGRMIYAIILVRVIQIPVHGVLWKGRGIRQIKMNVQGKPVKMGIFIKLQLNKNSIFGWSTPYFLTFPHKNWYF